MCNYRYVGLIFLQHKVYLWIDCCVPDPSQSDRQTDRWRDRQTDSQTNRKKERQTIRQTNKQKTDRLVTNLPMLVCSSSSTGCMSGLIAMRLILVGSCRALPCFCKIDICSMVSVKLTQLPCHDRMPSLPEREK